MRGDRKEKLQEVSLGGEALAYVRKQCMLGHSLGRELARLSLQGGTCATYLPPGYPSSALLRFDAGGVSRRHSKAKARVADVVWSSLAGALPGAAIFVIEESLGRRSDPAIMREAAARFYFHDEVYYYAVSGSDIMATDIVAMLGKGGDYPLVTAVSKVSPYEVILEDGSEVAEGTFSLLARSADQVIVAAYDAEGYVLWRATR